MSHWFLQLTRNNPSVGGFGNQGGDVLCLWGGKL